MKPSERIEQIANKNSGPNEIWIDRFGALIEYLDEEWEKNQPCKHEETETEKYGTGQMDVCKKCGAMGHFPKNV